MSVGGTADLTERDPKSAPLVGTVLEGAYQITRLIGEGGMGAVYEAIQLRLNKRVAVKVMARELAFNREAFARFHREAEITSHLGHPHLVNVIDFGMADSGEPYMVMEYLDGEDLDHRIRVAGRLPLETAVHITKQVASALAAAHAQDVVHRDLKPANIFLLRVPGESDFVKVLDFGISKMKTARTRLTRKLAVMGTPNYMSPEQAMGRVDEIDHRADQWSLACITWEMLSGRGPFLADESVAVIYQVINVEPQPLAARVPDLPAGVEPVLRRALSKRMINRYPSIRDFSRALQEAALGGEADVTPAPEMLPIGPTAERKPQSAPLPGSPAAGPDDLEATGKTEPDAARQVTTFSQTASELTERSSARRLRPIHAFVAAAALVLAVGAWLWLGAGGSRKPITSQPPPAAVAPVVTPAPAPAPAIPAEPEPPAPDRMVKAGSEKASATVRPAERATKRKTSKVRPKRRIFENL